jgi:hypothetical protein
MSALNFPANPQAGDTWSQNGKTYIFNGTSWAASTVFTGAEASELPPAEPLENQLWWSSSEGALRIYYIDPDGTGQWVDTNGGVNLLDSPFDQSLNTTDNVRFANVTTSELHSSSNVLNFSTADVGITLSSQTQYSFPPTILEADGYPWIVAKGDFAGAELSYTSSPSMENFYAPGIMSSSIYINGNGFGIDLDYNELEGTYQSWTFDNDGKLYLATGGLRFDDSTEQNTAYKQNETVIFQNGTSGSLQNLECGVNSDYATIFRFTNVSGNFTGNLLNLNFETVGGIFNKALSVSVVISQGATPYVCNAIQIEGVAQTVIWQGSAAAPTGNANKTDVIAFSIIRTGSGTTDYIVLGQLVSFG